MAAKSSSGVNPTGWLVMSRTLKSRMSRRRAAVDILALVMDDEVGLGVWRESYRVDEVRRVDAILCPKSRWVSWLE